MAKKSKARIERDREKARARAAIRTVTNERLVLEELRNEYPDHTSKDIEALLARSTPAFREALLMRMTTRVADRLAAIAKFRTTRVMF